MDEVTSSKPGPLVVVCLGAGGVGKTSCAAALALAFARSGKRTLAVTLDPARRLEDAIGDGGEGLPLYVHQPEARREFAELVDELFVDRIGDRERLNRNRIFQALSSGLAGMHEMAAVARLPTLVATQDPEVIVIDTAPTRHALTSMRVASRVTDLVDSRVIAVIARLLGSSRAGNMGRLRRAIGRLARRPVAKVLEATVGERPVVEMVELLELLLTVRPRLAALANSAEVLLRGCRTRYVVVTNTTASASGTASYLAAEATALGRAPTAYVINRATTEVPPWLSGLAGRRDVPDAFRDAVNELVGEDEAGVASTHRTCGQLARQHEAIPQIIVPRFDASEPTQVVERLSVRLGRDLKPQLEAA